MEFSFIDETSETTQNSIIMEVYNHYHGVENNSDFFPVEHPMEPQNEDRPVKCPMPQSSVITVSMCYSFFCYYLLLILRLQIRFCMVIKES
jgi:hypothetical protein